MANLESYDELYDLPQLPDDPAMNLGREMTDAIRFKEKTHRRHIVGSIATDGIYTEA